MSPTFARPELWPSNVGLEEFESHTWVNVDTLSFKEGCAMRLADLKRPRGASTSDCGDGAFSQPRKRAEASPIRWPLGDTSLIKMHF